MNSSRKICEYIKVKTPIISVVFYIYINQRMIKVIMAEEEFVRWVRLKVMVILEVHCKGLWEKVLHRSHCQYFESVFK